MVTFRKKLTIKFPHDRLPWISVQPTETPPLPCYMLSLPEGHSEAQRIKSMQNSNENMRNRIRELPASSPVPQPTATRRILSSYICILPFKNRNRIDRVAA